MPWYFAVSACKFLVLMLDMFSPLSSPPRNSIVGTGDCMIMDCDCNSQYAGKGHVPYAITSLVQLNPVQPTGVENYELHIDEERRYL